MNMFEALKEMVPVYNVRSALQLQTAAAAAAALPG